MPQNDYTNYDYNGLVEYITEKLGNKEGWGEGFQSSVGQMLIQLFADTTDSLHYLMERRATESFISTARLESSIFAHASELGYRPRRVVANTGTVQITLKDVNGVTITAGDTIIIPKDKVITLTDDALTAPVSFVVTEEVQIAAGQSTATIPVREGVPVSITVDATTTEFLNNRDVVIPNYQSIDEYSISVNNNGEKYHDIETTDEPEYNFGTLAYAGESDPVYDVRYAVEGLRIVFGDGVFGKQPDGVVTVSYTQSNNLAEPILTTGLQFTFNEEFLEDESLSLPKTQYFYEITNTTQIRGYTPTEDIFEIAENAPQYARANNRAVTNDDYIFWVKRSGIGGITDANVYGEQETGSLIFNMNHINIAYSTSDGEELTVDQETQLRTLLNRLRVGLVHPVITPARQIEAAVVVNFKKNTSLPISNEQLYKFLRESIEGFFDSKTGSVGGFFQHSELVSFIQKLTYTFNGITYNTTDYVRVDVTPQHKLPDSYPLYDALITLSDSYVPVNGSVWRITIDGVDFEVTTVAGEVLKELVERMRVQISDNSTYITSIEGVDELTIRVTSNYVDQGFVLDTSGGDLSAETTTNQKYKIPSQLIKNTTILDQVIAGSVQIIDSLGNVVFQDDGAGTLVYQGTGADIGIDYFEVEITDPYKPNPSETYYLRFQQDNFENIEVSPDSVIVLSPIAETIYDTPLLSKITII